MTSGPRKIVLNVPSPDNRVVNLLDLSALTLLLQPEAGRALLHRLMDRPPGLTAASVFAVEALCARARKARDPERAALVLGRLWSDSPPLAYDSPSAAAAAHAPPGYPEPLRRPAAQAVAHRLVLISARPQAYPPWNGLAVVDARAPIRHWRPAAAM